MLSTDMGGFRVAGLPLLESTATHTLKWGIGGGTKFLATNDYQNYYTGATWTVSNVDALATTGTCFVKSMSMGTFAGVYFQVANGGSGNINYGGNGLSVTSVSNVISLHAGVGLGASHSLGWTSVSATGIGTPDTTLYRDAADTLALRRTTNAQTARIYGTYTDASNYVRASLAATSTAVTLAAETAGTGADDVPLTITAGGVSHVISGSPLRLPSFTVATLPSAATAAAMIYVSDETGGAVLAFSDGTNWRRVTDRAIVA